MRISFQYVELQGIVIGIADVGILEDIAEVRELAVIGSSLLLGVGVIIAGRRLIDIHILRQSGRMIADIRCVQ
jgi:hypothetical protein